MLRTLYALAGFSTCQAMNYVVFLHTFFAVTALISLALLLAILFNVDRREDGDV